MNNKLEYIPGDLVMVKESALQFAKDKIFKVISSLSGCFLNVVMLNDSSTTYSISNNAIRPIPLTPEILEKNGWEKVVCRFLYCRKEFETLTFRLFDEDYGWTLRCGNQNLIKKVEFVHELQHLLFGLGLNHKMEV